MAKIFMVHAEIRQLRYVTQVTVRVRVRINPNDNTRLLFKV